MARENGRQGGGRGGNRGGNGRRDSRAKAAAAHIEEMEQRFGKEIEASAAGTLRIDGMPKKKSEAVKADAEAPVAAAEETAVSVEEPAGAPTAGDAPEGAAPEAVPEVSEAASESEAAVAETEPAPEEPIMVSAPEPEPAPEPVIPTVTVVDQDAVATILERGRGRAQYCDLTVLDFASFTTPGGGYDRGTWAQEQALCSESFLFNVLNRNKDWYAENRRRNLNCNLYRDRALVVPKVRFTRDRIHAYADVLVVAAPNATYAKSDYGVSDEALESAMRDRIKFVLACADQMGNEKIVLGAFGCGAFGWDAEVVAPMFLEELASGGHIVTDVVFAVPKARYNKNFEQFQHAFAMFPEKNEVSFADAQAAAAAAADARAETEDEEDDWRKYL